MPTADDVSPFTAIDLANLPVEWIGNLTRGGWLRKGQALGDCLANVHRWLRTSSIEEIGDFLSAPRFCGMADNAVVEQLTKWPDDRDILWDKQQGLPAVFTDEAIQSALDLWGGVTPLSFRRVKPGEIVDIVLTPARLDGPGGVLADSELGKVQGRPTRQRYDLAERWEDIVLSVLIHELGHALGLGHYPGGIMAPTLSNIKKITPVDVRAIQQIYGPRVVPVPPRPVPGDPRPIPPGNPAGIVEVKFQMVQGGSWSSLSLGNPHHVQIFRDGVEQQIGPKRVMLSDPFGN